MPIGVLTNCAAVLVGGLLGTALGRILPQGLKDNLPTLFGFCSIAIGVNSIIKASGMTAVVLAILVGFAIGHSLHLEQWTSKFFHKLVRTLHLGGGPVLLQRLRLVQHPDRGHHGRSLTADVQSRAGRLHGHDLRLHAGCSHLRYPAAPGGHPAPCVRSWQTAGQCADLHHVCGPVRLRRHSNHGGRLPGV